MDNPQAFPTNFPPTSRDGAECAGMTLRDWFAGQALAGWTAHPNAKGPQSTEDSRCFHTYARQVYSMADAMLAERAKDTPSHG